MQSESIKTLGFLGRPQQCVLPIFQRKYNWEKNNQCKTLLKDLEYVGSEETRYNWYLGAIVCQNTGGNLARPVFVLIDGQQRLTTVTIILCAITEYLRKHPKTKLDEVKNWDSLLKTYVINSEEDGDKWYRLLLNNEDKEDLKELIYMVSAGEDIPKYKGKSNVFSNYHFFRRHINKNNIEAVYNGLRKLEMIHISLDEHDVAQNIFETLNSTGQSLEKIDQIRNYLLMGLESDNAEDIYRHYWRPMETAFDENKINNSNHFNFFARYYLIIKLGVLVRNDVVYDKFRMVSDNFENAITCIKELKEFSEYYLKLFADCEEDITLKKEFRDFQVLGMRNLSPFLMKLYQKYALGEMPKEDVISIIRILKSYHVRKSICGWPNNGLGPVGVKLIKNLDSEGVEGIVKNMLSLKGANRFVPDLQVRENIPFQNFKSYSRLKFVLDKLVNFEKSAPIDTSELKVKEICPDVSEDDAIKLGNFTLEGIDLCMDIEADSNEEFIDKRTEMMTDLILRVWEYPTL